MSRIFDRSMSRPGPPRRLPSGGLSARLLLAVLVVAGPLFALLARADQGPWIKPPEFLLFSDLALPFWLVWSASLALGLVCGGYGILRSVMSTIITLVVCLFCGLIAGYLMLGAAKAGYCNVAIPAAAWLFVGLGGAFAHCRLAPVQGYRFWQFVALLAAPSGAALISLTISPGFCSGPRLIPDHFWSYVPALAALLPTVALVFAVSRRVSPARLMALLVFAALPPYAAKAAIDAEEYRIEQSLLWPARAHAEFISHTERQKLVNRLREFPSGEPVRIGEFWYRFQRAGWNPFIGSERRPDRVNFAQIYVLPEDIELPDLGVPRGSRVVLHVGIGGPRERSPLRDPMIRATYEDLSIGVVAKVADEAERAVIRQRLHDFMQAARTAPHAP